MSVYTCHACRLSVPVCALGITLQRSDCISFTYTTVYLSSHIATDEKDLYRYSCMHWVYLAVVQGMGAR